MMSVSLDSLKQSLRKLAPTALITPAPTPASSPGQERRRDCPTGIIALDAHLEAGGLPPGTITELAGAPSSGKTAVALTIAAALTRRQNESENKNARQSRRSLCGFIDGRNELYPPAAAALGVELERLLWVRPGGKLTAAARAAEILIRSRAFALLIIDLPRGARLTRSIAMRLRTSASQTSTSLIVLCDRAGDVEQAHTRLQASRQRGETSLLIHKGSTTGAPRAVAVSFERRRAAALPAPPIAPIANRVAPGTEPPSARSPQPNAFPMSLAGAI